MFYVDLFLYDIKLADEKEHEKYTGVSNKIIKENLKFLVENYRTKTETKLRRYLKTHPMFILL